MKIIPPQYSCKVKNATFVPPGAEMDPDADFVYGKSPTHWRDGWKTVDYNSTGIHEGSDSAGKKKHEK